jgi:hypothetical protein
MLKKKKKKEKKNHSKHIFLPKVGRVDEQLHSKIRFLVTNQFLSQTRISNNA